jgi:hypothetical protein
MSQSRTFQLLIKNTQEPCVLTELTIEIVIAGFLCKTSVTMVFKNPTDNETEGEVTNKSSYVIVFKEYITIVSSFQAMKFLEFQFFNSFFAFLHTNMISLFN